MDLLGDKTRCINNAILIKGENEVNNILKDYLNDKEDIYGLMKDKERDKVLDICGNNKILLYGKEIILL